MKLLVFILNKPELLDAALEAYLEAGIPGATIIDSEGMGRFLSAEVPLFADFAEVFKGNQPSNRTILSVVKDPEAVPRLRALVEETVGSLSDPGTGLMFTVPVDWVAGPHALEGEETAK
jgi:nitrogen regulatory protein PII